MTEIQTERLIQALERLSSAVERVIVLLAKTAEKAADKSVFEHIFGK